MENLLDNLKQLLKKDERLISEDELLKNKIIELAIKLDKDLIKLLMSDKNMKDVFFVDIDGTLIFDKDKFIKFISNKQFLPDSYTAFKNKIGLIDEKGEFISEKKEVVLSWPYKDCVLEGGMTKEDQKRDEIFWNEILAPDEITRLLDPKVFTNAKRIDAKGEHKLDKFKTEEKGDIKDNLIIKGNNFLALHSLKERFAGKVKLIYIDPPYNTGGADETFNYNDSFNHSTWLTFMRNRLEIAKDLLSKEGAIYVQLDYNEVHYCKVLMDEIFGRENFQREIIWRIGWVSGYKTADKNWIRNHDTILFYSKNKSSLEFFKKYIPYPKNYTRRDGSKPEGEGYPYEDTWNCSEIDQLNSIAIVSFTKEKVGNFKGQKNETLIKRIIEAHTKEGDVVLDFFSGTGTTASVAHKLKRQWITIEQMDEQMNRQLDRLKKVLKGDQIGISKEVNWQGGGDFVYLELMKWNENFADEIQKAKTKNELKKLWETMKEKAFLSYKVDIKTIDENAKDFADLSIEDQKRFLLECLDKNHLYVNYSEIDDEEYGVSEEDKKLNRGFYNKL
jgi:adenine-specific DNA-methyltransferase